MSGLLYQVSPGTSMAVRGLAISLGALVVMNYFGLGGAASIMSTINVVPALVIGIVALLIELYLPNVESYVESNV
jgi:hypothetical protein